MENDDRKQTPKRVPPAVQLDQVDSDLAMAITLQEQERANFGLLGTLDEGEAQEGDEDDYYEDEDESDDWGSSNEDHEYEYLEGEYLEEEDSNADEEMEEDEIDPDELSYEELIALGEIIGEEKRGLSSDEIGSCLFPSKFVLLENQTGIDRCVVCQVEFGNGENLVGLSPCNHSYHPYCITKWLHIRKNCPICSTEIIAPKDKNV